MRRSERGFTLMEIVAALVLLGIVAVPLVRMFVNSFEFQGMTELKSEANEVAQLVAERLKDGTLTAMNDALDAAGNAVPTKVELTSTDLNVSNLAQDYKIEISGISVEKGSGSPDKTPSEFDYTLTLKADGGATELPEGAGVSYSATDSLLTISSSLDPAEGKSVDYNFLIDNQTENELTVFIRKETTANVTIYTKGLHRVNMTSKAVGLTREQNTFSRHHLGTNDQLTNTTQDLYNVVIIVTSITDDSITTTMNATFTREVEVKE